MNPEEYELIRKLFDKVEANALERQKGFIAAVNDGNERILNKLNALEQDFVNTKGFLIQDAIIATRRWLDLDERVTRIETKLREEGE